MRIDELKEALKDIEEVISIRLSKDVLELANKILNNDTVLKNKFTSQEEFLSFVLKVAIKNLVQDLSSDNDIIESTKTFTKQNSSTSSNSNRQVFSKDEFQNRFKIEEELHIDKKVYLKVFDKEEIEKNTKLKEQGKLKTRTRIAKIYYFATTDEKSEFREISAVPFSNTQKELERRKKEEESKL